VLEGNKLRWFRDASMAFYCGSIALSTIVHVTILRPNRGGAPGGKK
jgi:hypothetical protein